jgi:hypothetical protein
MKLKRSVPGGPAELARRRALESRLPYRGLTFTEKGCVLLDVDGIKEGRLCLRQNETKLKLLPETLLGIQSAWREGDIPDSEDAPWTISTFSAYDPEKDDLRVYRTRRGDSICLADSGAGTRLVMTAKQLDAIVEALVDPWMNQVAKASAPERSPAVDGPSLN